LAQENLGELFEIDEAELGEDIYCKRIELVREDIEKQQYFQIEVTSAQGK
jgi:hypothetical protein